MTEERLAVELKALRDQLDDDDDDARFAECKELVAPFITQVDALVERLTADAKERAVCKVDEKVVHLSFLFDSYEPGCMYFEVFECIRKLLLTGMMTFFYPGTASQIAIGLLIAFASAIFYSHFKPFVEDHDDLVSEVTQCQTFFVLLTALMSFISSDNYVAKGAKAGDFYSAAVFGWLLIIVSLLGPALAIALVCEENAGSAQCLVRLVKRKGGKDEGDEGEGDGSERVGEGTSCVGAEAGLELLVVEVEDRNEVPRAPERPKASPLDKPERAGASGIIGVEFLCCEERE